MAGHVEQVAIDPFTHYAKAIPHLLPHAVLVVDKFHVLRLFGRAVDQVRRRAVRQTEGRGLKIDRLWRSRMVLLKRFERLTDTQQQGLFGALDGEDHRGGRRRLPGLPRSPQLDLVHLAVAAFGGGVGGTGLEVGDDLGQPPVEGAAEGLEFGPAAVREPAEQLAESRPQSVGAGAVEHDRATRARNGATC